MGRRARPWWWTERGRWAATVGGKRHLAPPEIPEKDEHAAFEWHRRLLDSVRPGEVQRVGPLLIRDIVEQYLEWDLERVEGEDRSRDGHESTRTKISLFSQTRLDGQRIGAMHASRFTASHLDRAMTAWKRDGRSQGYIVALVGTVKAMWAWAARPISGRDPERLIKEDPVGGFQGPPVPKAAPRYAEPGEAAAWLRWLRSRKVDRSFLLLQRALIRSGARPSEMIRARWCDVDWSGWASDEGHVGAIVTLERWKNIRKTGRPRRIFLTPPIRRSLLNTVGRQSPSPETPLFTNADGHPWSSATVLGNRVMRQRRAAIRRDEREGRAPRFQDEGPEKLVNYRWRHTAASSLLMSNVDVPTVAELLGTSPDMILRTYGHLLNRHLAKGAARFHRKN